MRWQDSGDTASTPRRRDRRRGEVSAHTSDQNRRSLVAVKVMSSCERLTPRRCEMRRCVGPTKQSVKILDGSDEMDCEPRCFDSTWGLSPKFPSCRDERGERDKTLTAVS
jgi:hypothetical protein